MALDIKMPALSPTMEEGTLSKWLKNEGDKVTSGDVIADRRADYARMRGEDPSATNYVVGIRFWF